MKINIKLTIILAIITSFSLLSCVKKDFDQPELPNPCDADPGLSPNINIFEIQKMYNTGKLDTLQGDILAFPKDSNYVLEATVVSSDEYGNFYKELFIQDSTGAMLVSIDQKELYNDFNLGQVIQIKLSDLNIQKDSWEAIFILGKDISNGDVGRISSNFVNDYIFRKSCPKPDNLNPKLLTIGSFYDTEVGKYVKFDNVEFVNKDVGTTYFDPNNSGGHGTNKIIENCNGDTLIVRTSEYATFANDTIPGGNGSIKGVLTKYGQDYQLYIIKPDDIIMTNNRCN